MTFILITGEPNRGKTYVCNKLHKIIETDKTFTVNNPQPMGGFDFMRHYEKDGKCIVLNSPSDDDRRLEQFANYLDGLAQSGVRPDIIITTIRETDDIDKKAYPMSHTLALLEAIASGTPNLEGYYKQNIASITSFTPTSLVHNAFVLHLEKQNVDGVADKNKALAQYADGKAETAKQMLDLVLARLSPRQAR